MAIVELQPEPVEQPTSDDARILCVCGCPACNDFDHTQPPTIGRIRHIRCDLIHVASPWLTGADTDLIA